MSEPGATDQPRQPAAPAPGWYHDEHGLVRWWDGSGWTEHIQMPAQGAEVSLAPGFAPTPTPSPNQAGSGGPNYLPWVLALVSVLALCIASVLILKGLGGDEGNDTDAIPSGDVTQVQSGLSAAQTAIETYAVDHNGSYEGATPEELAAIDGTLADVPLTVSGTASGYVLSAAAGEVTFSITRAEGGVVTFACTPPGGEGCNDSGTWGEAVIAELDEPTAAAGGLS